MSIKFYKLNYYKPYWTIDNTILPYDHVETIVSGIEEYVNKAQNSNLSLWEEITNFEWKDIDNISCKGTKEDIPDYVKVDVNGDIYYYYLLHLGNVTAVKGNSTYYSPIYQLDKYMTIFCNKMHIMYDKNPNVYALFGFQNRWEKRVEGNTDTYYIDFVSQRHLSNTQPRNNMMVRELAYYTTPTTLFSLNFPDTVPPETVTFTEHGGSTTMTRTWTEMTNANSRGRYEYIVCKPTSIMSSNNDKIRSSATSQKFIIIPLMESYKESLLHALNDFDIAGTHNKILDPWGDNEIGLYECDIPYSIFYGYNANSQHGVTLEYINQPMDTDGNTSIQIPFFRVNNNAPMVLKIIDYTNYGVGFYGKFKYFIENIYEWSPDTEPALWNPTYYKEVYNNGNSNLITDASFFKWKWDATSELKMGVQAYLSFQDNLNIAYNYGTSTNSALSTLDNTETINGNLSLSNMYFGSSSANYFTTNATTTATSLAVRKSEQNQAIVDATLDSAKALNSSVTAPTLRNGILPWNYAINAAKAATNAALSISKTIADTVMSQKRANMQLRSGINNLTSSPAPVVANPSTKGVIPNKYNLFDTYSIKLHPNDEAAIFVDYCNNGYPLNQMVKFDNLFNRKFMNVLHLDTTYFSDILKNIIVYNDETIFNTPTWNFEFLSWLNEPHKVYNTWWLVNCTDYYGDNYYSNVEQELPDIPRPKININTLITNFSDAYPWDNIINTLHTDNPEAPSDLWSIIEITNITSYGFIIKAKSASTSYYGSITVPKTVYDGFIDTGTTRHYFFGTADFLCNTSNEGYPKVLDFEIICPDGTNLGKIGDFNYEINFNSSISFNKIKHNFLAWAEKMNSYISLGNADGLVYGVNFMYGMKEFTTQIEFNTLKPENFQDYLQSPSTSATSNWLSAQNNLVPAFTTGFYAMGAYVTQLKEAFPDHLGSLPWRKWRS